ncbi:hypothetical protein EYC84_000454 [Monilinia fructicola]|uniref:Uncharacterized protein n=2 Tax=Monilinia fructicola TaxID=38448 RepID=A0A5M9JRR5_MONFR|nr:hypothetical protein EYC84_000454 [Monilinia fructicola]
MSLQAKPQIDTKSLKPLIFVAVMVYRRQIECSVLEETCNEDCFTPILTRDEAGRRRSMLVYVITLFEEWDNNLSLLYQQLKFITQIEFTWKVSRDCELIVDSRQLINDNLQLTINSYRNYAGMEDQIYINCESNIRISVKLIMTIPIIEHQSHPMAFMKSSM